jgi:hypothetical protein
MVTVYFEVQSELIIMTIILHFRYGFPKLSLGPGCIKRCQVVVKVNIMSSDLIG